MSKANAPAFPSGLVDPSTPEDAVLPVNNGMTLRQYAAIKLRVPDSGDDWLDAMIRKSIRNDFAAKMMQALVGSPLCGTTFDVTDKANDAYVIADVMIEKGANRA